MPSIAAFPSEIEVDFRINPLRMHLLALVHAFGIVIFSYETLNRFVENGLSFELREQVGDGLFELPVGQAGKLILDSFLNISGFCKNFSKMNLETASAFPVTTSGS